MPKVKSLTVRNFRGISQQAILNLTSNQGKVTSTLVLGDNGSGKSSLADAFEFCLRGKVSRRGNAGLKSRREARNLLSNRAPFVSVELENGKRFFRGHTQSRQLPGERLTDFASGYSLCPTVLSRSDIEAFWKLSDSERMRFFFDYLRDNSSHVGYIALEIERTELELKNVRTALLEAQIALATVADVPVSEIPNRGILAFEKWKNRNFPVQVAGSSRRRSRVPKRVQTALAELESQLKRTATLKQHIAAQKKQAGFKEQVAPVISADLPALLHSITSQVSEDFSRIAGLTHVTKVEIAASQAGEGLDIKCLLSTGNYVDPVQVLSEGSLDLLALLIMLGVALECAKRGQSKFLVLDDVWQSVDTVHRNAILDFIFEQRFKSWQLVVTVHDRLWARLIEEKAKKFNFPLRTVELSRWSSDHGPILTDTSLSTASQLSEMLAKSAPESLCAYAGRSLEELSNRLSMTMRVSVSRAPGDRYTLEDVWPGVFSGIKKAALPEELKNTAKEVNEIYALRNIYGAHYATWAESMSRTEVEKFASLVLDLWNEVHCKVCSQPLSLVFIKKTRVIDWPCDHNDPKEAEVEKASS